MRSRRNISCDFWNHEYYAIISLCSKIFLETFIVIVAMCTRIFSWGTRGFRRLAANPSGKCGNSRLLTASAATCSGSIPNLSTNNWAGNVTWNSVSWNCVQPRLGLKLFFVVDDGRHIILPLFPQLVHRYPNFLHRWKNCKISQAMHLFYGCSGQAIHLSHQQTYNQHVAVRPRGKM